MRVLRWGLSLVAIGGVEVLANHELRLSFSDLLGPTAWALYLIVPMPFVILGIIAWKLYRTISKKDQ